MTNKTLLVISSSITALALLTACLPTTDDGDGGLPPTTLALAAIKAVKPDGSGDTSVYATYTYDPSGMRVRERRDFITRGWDSLGRYVLWTQHNHRDTVEIVTWFASDSSARGARNSSLITRERWFGLRPNCQCADSSYRYRYDGALLHVRRFTYDALGSLTLVTRDFPNPARRDTAQRFENHYEEGRLTWRISNDHETEDTTRQLFVYAPLESMLENR